MNSTVSLFWKFWSLRPRSTLRPALIACVFSTFVKVSVNISEELYANRSWPIGSQRSPTGWLQVLIRLTGATVDCWPQGPLKFGKPSSESPTLDGSVWKMSSFSLLNVNRNSLVVVGLSTLVRLTAAERPLFLCEIELGRS